jgi:hypothetical protein
MLINTAASNVMLPREGGFLQFIAMLGVAWTALMIISGIKAIHQYSVPKTLAAIVFTIGAMAIMLFVVVLLVSLFQQVYIFFSTIYSELLYRF